MWVTDVGCLSMPHVLVSLRVLEVHISAFKDNTIGVKCVFFSKGTSNHPHMTLVSFSNSQDGSNEACPFPATSGVFFAASNFSS